MTDTWKSVAISFYGLCNPNLLYTQKHQSFHYFIEDHDRRYVLSSSSQETNRLPKTYQFDIISFLISQNYEFTTLPIQTTQGEFCLVYEDQWWVLKQFGISDRSPNWESEELVKKAARGSAMLHELGKDYKDKIREISQVKLAPFYWSSIEWAKQINQIAKGFHWSNLSTTDTKLIVTAIDFIEDNLSEIELQINLHKLQSITHQDYRPANIRVLQGEILEVWDFDLARIDCSLYDLAFSCLQFGGRECLFPNISLVLADSFITEYLAVRGLEFLRFQYQYILKWFLTVAVLKRLLMNWHITDRINLLERINNTPKLWTR
jgi:Ser/Thr protein kinase RdoA (MazF antagonist)